MNITRAQITRLQTCCSQMAQRVAGCTNSREERLAWAAQVLGHAVESFAKLSMQEARILIDAAQGEIGHRAPLKPGTRRNREDARRAGIDGRKGDTEFASAPRIVSAEELTTIASYYQRLGWDKPRFDAWLASRHSPLKKRTTITTSAHANRVLWALKGMLKDAGLWVDWSTA